MNYLLNTILLLFLLINAWHDLKDRIIVPRISLWFGAAGIVWHLLQPGPGVLETLAGILPGLVLFSVSVVFPEELGRGDGYVLMACGIWLGAADTMELLITAFILAGAVSLLLLLFRRANRRTSLPFIPFLLAARLLSFTVL